jgi:hypothetical protein
MSIRSKKNFFITGLILFCLIFTCSISGFAEIPQCAVISAMDNPDAWEGTVKPQVVTHNGRKCLMFDLGKGGQYKWTLKDFAKCGIDLEQYQALKFDYCIEGGQALISTEVRQWPWMGGYSCLFYQDTLPCPQDKWLTNTALQPENAWGSSWSKSENMFVLDISRGQAEPGKSLKVYLDNIRVVRYPFTVNCVSDIFLDLGEREDKPDGSIVYRYPLKAKNHTDKPLQIELNFNDKGLKLFKPEVPQKSFTLPPKGEVTTLITLTLSGAERKKLKPLYYERAVVGFSVKGIPETEFDVNLLPAVPHKAPPHPYLYATGKRFEEVKKWRKQYGWVRGAWDQYIKRADFALNLPDKFPDFQSKPEQPEDRICPNCKEKTKLRKLDENLPAYQHLTLAYRYQCENCGKMLSRRRSDAHMGLKENNWWTPKAGTPASAHAISFNKNGTVLDLAIAWRLTGEKKYLDKASKVLKEYLRVLPTYPFRDAGLVEFGIGGKGKQKFGNYFSQNGWLQMVSCTLDLLWDSGALTAQERTALLKELKVIFLNRLRMQVGSAHRINEGGAALAQLCDDASLQAHLLYDPYQGAISDFKRMFSDDGFCLMAAQYMEPVVMAWLGTLNIYRNMDLDLSQEVPALKRFPIVMQQWLDPDGYCPAMGDAVAFSPLGRTYWFELFYLWYRNPQSIVPVQRKIYQQWKNSKSFTHWEDIARQGGPSTRSCAALFRCAEHVPRGDNPLPNGSYDFPGYGLLVFNQGEGEKRLWASLPYGKLLGHGFNDNMHLEWWALGQKQTIRSGARARTHALNHNTLLVDGLNQNKVPCEVTGFKNEGAVQGAILSSSSMYPGVKLQRCIMLYDGIIFLFDLFKSDKTHSYDMVYTNFGIPHCELPFNPLKNQLVLEPGYRNNRGVAGQVGGYSLMLNPEEAKAPELFQITWDSLKNESANMRLTQLATGTNTGTVFRANVPVEKGGFESRTANPKKAYKAWPKRLKGERPEVMGTKFIRRINAREAGLLTILEAYKGKAPRLKDFKVIPLKLNGKPTDKGISVEYTDERGNKHQIIMCPEAGTKTAGNAETDALFTAGSIGLMR